MAQSNGPLQQTSIVMAEQHNVVEKSLSGGDPSSPSGVPASTNDKDISAGEGVGEIGNTTSQQQQPEDHDQQTYGADMTNTMLASIDGDSKDGRGNQGSTHVSNATDGEGPKRKEKKKKNLT